MLKCTLKWISISQLYFIRTEGIELPVHHMGNW